MDSAAYVIQRCLTAGTALAALVGNRVGERLPDGFSNSQAAIVVMRTTGGRDNYEAVDEPVFTFQCYGGTARRVSAEAVAQALIVLFHRQYSVTVAGYGRQVMGEVVSQFDWVDVAFDPAAPVVVVMMRLKVSE